MRDTECDYKRTAIWAIRILLCLWITLIYFYSPGFSNTGADLHKMIAGTADRPYVTRVLMSWTIRAIVEATPANMQNSIEHNTLTERLKQTWYMQKELRWVPNCYEHIVGFVLSFLCLVAFSLVCRALWRYLCASGESFAEGFSIVAVLGIPALLGYSSYIYDFPTLLFFTLCLWLMVQGRWLIYGIAFACCCASKETAVLLPVIFAIYYVKHRRDDRLLYISLLAFQILLFIFVRLVIAYIYRNNPGGSHEHHFADHNLRMLTTAFSFKTLIPWFLLIAMVLNQWSTKPIFLRIAASMLVPLLILCLPFGFIDELRDYYEVYPPILMLAAISFLRLLGHGVGTRAPTQFSSVRSFVK